MRICADFVGGNIRLLSQSDRECLVTPDLRDSPEWFYWAFRAEDMTPGQTYTFRFDKPWVGPYGPAVSRDLRHWEWLGERIDDRTFAYRPAGDGPVFFAHSYLYHPDRFDAFCAAHGWTQDLLTLSDKGCPVPCLRLGEGGRRLLLTARHHACESTGNYVLEGFLSAWAEAPLPGLSLFCVPFVDYDGVVEGDQGKDRRPRDHNRDYVPGEAARYASVGAIREWADTHSPTYALDLHSPWHRGGENDTVFIPYKHHDLLPALRRFSALLEAECTPGTFPHRAGDDIPPDVRWNRSDTPSFGAYMHAVAGARLSLTLETAYFVSHGVPFSEDGALALGRAVCRALGAFDAAEN